MTLPLELIRLPGLMALTSGNADVRIGLVVASDAHGGVRPLPAGSGPGCG